MPAKIQSFITRQYMLRHNFEVYRYRDSYLNDVALHHHDFYEIYLFLSGNVTYSIESRNYRLLPGDVLLISPLELHQPMFTWEKQPYERIVLWIDKSFFQELSRLGHDLTRCFDTSQPWHTNLLRADAASRQYITQLMERLIVENESSEFASDLAANACLLQLLILINRLAERTPQHYEVKDKSSPVISSVLGFINEHYSEDLSLDLLASKFFISKYHLSHEFNRLVGTSVYRYIIQKRLAIAKQLLSEGTPPTDVYQHCGFGDYANFYRAFKSEYRISPKEFITSLKAERTPLEEN